MTTAHTIRGIQRLPCQAPFLSKVLAEKGYKVLSRARIYTKGNRVSSCVQIHEILSLLGRVGPVMTEAVTRPKSRRWGGRVFLLHILHWQCEAKMSEHSPVDTPKPGKVAGSRG